MSCPSCIWGPTSLLESGRTAIKSSTYNQRPEMTTVISTHTMEHGSAASRRLTPESKTSHSCSQYRRDAKVQISPTAAIATPEEPIMMEERGSPCIPRAIRRSNTPSAINTTPYLMLFLSSIQPCGCRVKRCSARSARMNMKIPRAAPPTRNEQPTAH